MYFLNNGRRYGYLPVLLGDQKRIHRVATIYSADGGTLLWADAKIVCGRRGEWHHEPDADGQQCRDCLGWEGVLEREAPIALRPAY